jgi:uncharacterized protein YsxB (DUF464 family)
MINIKLFERNKRYAITCNGHAEYAPLGQDIVCASVSTLMYTLANYITDKADEKGWKILNITFDEDNTEVVIDVLDESDTNVLESLFSMISDQLKDIADMYPLNVKIAS